MSCVGDTCGVGGWGGPKPGDPSHDGSLSARSALDGIELSWTLPATNPFAVAYTTVYRSTTPHYEDALQITTAGGNSYFDKVGPGVTYWYWITFTSINGTVGNLIGPASNSANSSIDQLIVDLTNRIDAGVLAKALRDKIDRITGLDAEFLQEVQDRFGADSAIANAVEQLQTNVDGAVALFQQEIVKRTEGDSALVDAMSVMGVRVGDAMSAIVEEATTRASADEAMASRVTLLESSVAENNGVDSVARAAIQEEANTRATADNALASRITTLEASGDNGELAQVEQRLEAKIDNVNNKAESLYTMKLTANGLIGGFGMYNDGISVQAGFDVDMFWVGRTNASKKKPFIIDGDICYINDARLRFAAVETLMIGANQVTLPIGVYTAGDITCPFSTTTSVQSVGINSTGAPIIINACARMTPVADIYYVWRLYRDGVELYSLGNETFNGNPISYSFTANLIDTPGPGWHVYNLVLEVGNRVYPDDPNAPWPGLNVLKRTITLIEAKR